MVWRPCAFAPMVVKGKKAKLSSVSMIHNFHSYFQKTLNNFIKEMKGRQHYKAKDRTLYSSEFLRFAFEVWLCTSVSTIVAAFIFSINVSSTKVETRKS